MKENKKIWLCNKTDGKDKTDVLILLFWLKSDIKFDIKYWFDQLIKTSADSNETIWLKFLISVKKKCMFFYFLGFFFHDRFLSKSHLFIPRLRKHRAPDFNTRTLGANAEKLQQLPLKVTFLNDSCSFFFSLAGKNHQTETESRPRDIINDLNSHQPPEELNESLRLLVCVFFSSL